MPPQATTSPQLLPLRPRPGRGRALRPGRAAPARGSGGSSRRAAPASVFLAAGLADLAARVGTVILGWYIAALIVAGVVGTTAGHRLAADVLGVAAGGFLRAAGGFAADRLAAAGPAAPRLAPATLPWLRWFLVTRPMSR